MGRSHLKLGALLLALALGLSGCKDRPLSPEGGEPPDAQVTPEDEDLRTRFNLQPLGPIPYPPDNPPIPERIALGRLLFFDPILGGEKDVSCGT